MALRAPRRGHCGGGSRDGEDSDDNNEGALRALECPPDRQVAEVPGGPMQKRPATRRLSCWRDWEALGMGAQGVVCGRPGEGGLAGRGSRPPLCIRLHTRLTSASPTSPQLRGLLGSAQTTGLHGPCKVRGWSGASLGGSCQRSPGGRASSWERRGMRRSALRGMFPAQGVRRCPGVPLSLSSRVPPFTFVFCVFFF